MIRIGVSRKLSAVSVLACMFLVSVVAGVLFAETKELSLGVTYVDEPISTLKRWEPLGELLSKTLNSKVKVVPMDFSTSVQWIETGKVNLALTNPLIFFLSRDKAQLTPIAMIVQKTKGEAGDRYGSAIIAKADSPVKTLGELSGKTVGIASRFSLGGGLGGLALLEQEGVKVEQITIKELKNQDNVVFAVMNGTVDAGIVRTGIIEKLISEKKVSSNSLKILHKVDDNFPYVHSTPLWPEWLVVARASDLTAHEREQIKKALLGIATSNEALVKCGISGFKDPTDVLNTSSQFFDTILKIYQKISK
ncbi:MAG: phosphate/phosphite/phosphonate ABC transporter substrate-binding protein [Thermodesulforhabdaceae bacterium]